ncbi:MAG TPA: P1 family peptidase [Thermoplasmata archaeon]|nr:P1 family peptidase [Thermoplasmata archaeon]
MAGRPDFAAIRGVRVGQAESPDGRSGVTAVLFDALTPTVVDVRGGASATYDIASLALDATYGRRWAIFFAGGSLYGLDAARGIRVRLLEVGDHGTAFGNPNPVVQISGAALFDLPTTAGPIPDYLPLGYEAARAASHAPVRVGRCGAGAGATVGKYRGRDRAMRGGVGAAAARLPGGGMLGALVAVNAVGAVREPASGRWVAGARGRRGIVPPTPAFDRSERTSATTLALVATDRRVDRPTLQRIAALAQTGLAAAIVPFHSSTDGDVVFAAATGAVARPISERRAGETADRWGMRAAELCQEAVLRAVRRSNGR